MSGKVTRFIIGAVCELLTIRDPFDKHTPPEITGTYKDKNGRNVIQVRADNYRDLERYTDGTTIEGDVSRHCVHTGYKQWEIRVVDWNTDPHREG